MKELEFEYKFVESFAWASCVGVREDKRQNDFSMAKIRSENTEKARKNDAHRQPSCTILPSSSPTTSPTKPLIQTTIDDEQSDKMVMVRGKETVGMDTVGTSPIAHRVD